MIFTTRKTYQPKRLLGRVSIAARVMGLWLTVMAVTGVGAQGLPQLRLFSADEYHAHNFNFDIITHSDGHVFVANFEGLLYYDQVEWRVLRTPGNNRLTVVYKDRNDSIWVGGYNYVGKVSVKANGDLCLHRLTNSDAFRGEVEEIWEKDGHLQLLVSDGRMYRVENNTLVVAFEVSNQPLKMGMSDVVNTDALDNEGRVEMFSDVVQTEPLGNGLSVIVKKAQGVVVADAHGKELFTVSETNGLPTNSVNYVGYDGHGQLWGATDVGVFAMALPSAYSHYTAHEGLTGEVQSIVDYDGHIYVGTSNGIYRLDRHTFTSLGTSIHGCWQLQPSLVGLMAATASGIYVITAGGGLRQLTGQSAMSLHVEGTTVYSGEIDGVYAMDLAGRERHLVSPLEKVTRMVRASNGTLWLQSVYGEVWYKERNASGFSLYKSSKADEALAVVPLQGQVDVVGAGAVNPFPYPLFSMLDKDGVTWLTNNEGKHLYRWKDGQQLNDLNRLINPLRDFPVKTMLVRDGEVWIGGEKGLWIVNTRQQDSLLSRRPRLLFRTVRLGNDSILWGGFTPVPDELPALGSHERHLKFTYALDYAPMVAATLYRYRLKGGHWSAWSNDHDAEFVNLPYGSYTFEVQAMLPTGEQTEVASMDFSIDYPYYLRWYMMAFYFLLAGCLVYGLFRYRLHRLSVEKRRLERVVQERTAEVVKQKDEIEEKSKHLETALSELHQAQGQLIRQEKMATVGKLTQGLIDRILNPLNYINNFSKLSEGLVGDLEANIEDEKDHMDGDNYEDTVEVLGMLRGNLQKVGQHGLSTTRTLKAMEEMLKDHSGGIVPMELGSVLKRSEQLLRNYYAASIAKYGIQVSFTSPSQPMTLNGNAEQLGNVINQLLANAFYAVTKQAERSADYVPQVSVQAALEDDHVTVVVRDNGIGIEATIINKVFDPFFTTRPTGEASGVGLYLAHEIVQNHGGTITVASEKNIYTEFTIVLPITQQP